MNLNELKIAIEEVEGQLPGSIYVIIGEFERNGKKLRLAITDRLRSSCKKGHVWKSKQMLTALKNAQYGFEPNHAHSPGGSDGIFMLNRDYKQKNNMMKKIFDKFIDKPGSEARIIAEQLHVTIDNLIPVRVVSHHMRLLGLLKVDQTEDTLVLVDYDNTK